MGYALALAAFFAGGFRLLEAAAGDDADDAFCAASPTRCLGMARGSEPSLLINPLEASADDISACVASSSFCCSAAGAPICVVSSELAPEPVLSVIGDTGGMTTSEEAKLRGSVRRSTFLLEFL